MTHQKDIFDDSLDFDLEKIRNISLTRQLDELYLHIIPDFLNETQPQKKERKKIGLILEKFFKTDVRFLKKRIIQEKILKPKSFETLEKKFNDEELFFLLLIFINCKDTDFFCEEKTDAIIYSKKNSNIDKNRKIIKRILDIDIITDKKAFKEQSKMNNEEELPSYIG